jgi:type IV pilus assembly protein PilB
MRIGELLVMNGIINEEQLKHALQQQASTRKKLGEILIDHGNITERQLVEALEFQIGVPVVNVKEVNFDKATVHLIHEATARKYDIIPIEQAGGKMKMAMVDPLNHEAIKQIQMETGLTVQPLIATRSEVDQAINQHYGVTESIEELTRIIQSGVEQKATYIHFIPQEDELIIKYHIGNKLLLQKAIPKDKQESLINRIKIMSNLNVTERRLPQEGRLQTQTVNKQIDLCVSTLPTVNGESMLMRIMNYSEEIMKMTDLGLSDDNFRTMDKMIRQPSGMLLITGPSYSGKTSTLYSILHHLNTGEQNIISLEDPVERRIKGITQVEVNSRIGFTYTAALQSVLERNPDIVMIGDINGREAVEMAAKASISRRLTICGSQGHNAVQTISRLTELGIDNSLIASAITGIIAQRLVRRVCKHCAQTMPASDDETKLFEDHNLLNIDNEKTGNKSIIGNFRTYVTAQLSGKITVIRGNGCHACNHSGYYGFVGIHEALDVDQRLKQLIIKSLPDDELEQYLKEREYKTMLYDGLLKAREGMTTVEEVLKVVN